MLLSPNPVDCGRTIAISDSRPRDYPNTQMVSRVRYIAWFGSRRWPSRYSDALDFSPANRSLAPRERPRALR
jgi:hypothetical protein